MAGFDLAVTVVIPPAAYEQLERWWLAAGGVGDAPRPQPGRTAVFALARLADPPPGWVTAAAVSLDGPGTGATVDEPVGGRPEDQHRLLLGIVSHLRSGGRRTVRASSAGVAAALRDAVAGPERHHPGSVTEIEL